MPYQQNSPMLGIASQRDEKRNDGDNASRQKQPEKDREDPYTCNFIDPQDRISQSCHSGSYILGVPPYSDCGCVTNSLHGKCHRKILAERETSVKLVLAIDTAIGKVMNDYPKCRQLYMPYSVFSHCRLTCLSNCRLAKPIETVHKMCRSCHKRLLSPS